MRNLRFVRENSEVALKQEKFGVPGSHLERVVLRTAQCSI